LRAMCARTLPVGGGPPRYTPAGGDHYVDVCPLCNTIALQHGWAKEGAPTTPAAAPLRRRRRLSLAAIFDPREAGAEEPVVAEPILRRLSKPAPTLVEAPAQLHGAAST